jgi:AbiU2
VQNRYERAIQRNLAELQRAIMNRTTLLGFEAAGEISHLFLQVTYYALFNDYVAHCIKVFDRNKQSASFWYVHRTNEKPIKLFARRYKIKISSLDKVSAKLKQIRDKTHFHIDTDGVLDPKAVWRDANLSGKDLSAAVDAAWKILKHLEKSLQLPETMLPHYDLKVARRVAIAVEEGSINRDL